MANINNLPTDISLDIITRLPTESILDCKLVCKPWRDLVSHHPSFSRMHLSRLRDLNSGKLSFLVRDDTSKLQYFEYSQNNDQTLFHSIRRINLNRQFTSDYKVTGSLNGLVCLYGRRDRAYCICNPMTREYVKFPNSKRDYAHRSSGFGYLPLTNEYKVVELYSYHLRSGLEVIDVAVYTLGSGNGWRDLGRLDTEIHGIHVEDGVFVNGVLHWMDRKEKGRVLTFNLIAETFEYPLPLGMVKQPNHNMRTGFALGVFGGVLCCTIEYYSNVVKNTCFELWLQAEDEPLGWRKEFTLPGRKPLAFTNNGGVLCFNRWSLGIYDATTSTFKKHVDFSVLPRISPHMNTLVSLRQLGEEDIKIMEATV